MKNHTNFPYLLRNSTKTFLVFALTLFYQISFGQATYTATSSGTWGNASTWTLTSGSDGDGIPDADDDVIIPDGLTVSLSATQACDNLVINFGGILLFNNNDLTVESSIFLDNIGGITLFLTDPKGNGNWDAAANWLNGSKPSNSDAVYIANTTNQKVPTTALSGFITISSEGRIEGTTIRLSNASNSVMVDGTLDTTSGNLEIDSDKVVQGNGVIAASGQINLNTNTLTISSASDLLFEATRMENGTLDNNGNASFSCGFQSMSFNNLADAYAQFQISSPFSFTGTGLTATAAGNTVEYAFTDAGGTTNINYTTTYHSLVLSTGTGSNTNASLDINGDFIVNANTTINSGTTLNIGGNWTHNSGTITHTGSTVIFDGSIDQAISSSPLSTVNFNNLTINTSGSISTSENIQVENTLNMSQGNIVLDGTKLTVGTSTGSAGTLSYTAGYVVGQYEKWIGSAGTYKFPLGNATSSRILDVTLSATSFTAGSLEVQFNATAPGTSGLSGGLAVSSITIYNTFSEGHWNLTPANSLATDNYNVVAEAGDFSSFEFDDNNDARILVRTATDWTAGGQGSGSADAASSPKTVSASALDPFSSLDIAIGSALNCTAVDADAISGNTSVCTNAVEIYSASQIASSGTSEFSWQVTGGGLISEYSLDGTTYVDTTDVDSLSGEGFEYIRVVWPSTGTATASVSVSERASGCGFGAASTLDVVVGTAPPSGIGGRTVVAEGAQGIVYYLLDSIPGYTYTWSITNGTIVSDATGVGLDSITVDWGTVTGTQTISVVAQASGCTVAEEVTLSVNVYNVINSDGTFSWPNNNAWEGGSSPTSSESGRVLNSHTITLDASRTIRNLIINSGGTLDLSGNVLTVSGDIEIYGTITGTGTITMSGTNSNIIGNSAAIGDLTDNVNFTLQNSNTVLGGSDLTVTGNVTVASGASVTNNGSFQITGNLDGTDNTASWTNGQGTAASPTLLSVSGNLFNQGILRASNLYNTVSYTGSTTANIKIPENDTYHNLLINGSATKTIDGGSISLLDFTGNLTIQAGTLNFQNFDHPKYLNFNGTIAQAIDLSGGTIQRGGVSGVFPSFEVNNSAGITLNSNLTIYSGGTLTLTSGVVSTGANVLTVNNPASTAIVGTGSESMHINGILNRATASTDWYNFPMGTGTDFKRLEVQPETTSSHNFQAQSYDVSYGNTTLDESTLLTSNDANVSVLEYWNVDRTVGTDSARLRLHWDDAGESGIVDPSSDLVVAHWTGAAWESVGGTIGSGYVESDNVGSFSPFTFASPTGINPLPVEFTSFTAEQEQGKVNLKWATASEKNNSHFVVEHSTDGRNFSAIGEVEGGGNSTVELQYEFVDHSPASGSNFYRLRQVDYDGAWDYSRIVHLLYTVAEEDLINVYPNPVKDQFTVELLKEAIGPVSISLYNQLGIRVQMWNFKEGGHVFENHIDHKLEAGVYTVKILRSGMLPAATKIIVE